MSQCQYLFATGLGVTYAFRNVERQVEETFLIETLGASVEEAFDGDLVDARTGEVLVGFLTLDQAKEHMPNINFALSVTAYSTVLHREPFDLRLSIRPGAGFVKVDSEEKARDALSSIFHFNLHAMPKVAIKSDRPMRYFDVWGEHGGKDVFVPGVDKVDMLWSDAYWEAVRGKLVELSLESFLKELDHILLVNGASMLTAFAVEIIDSERALLLRWEDSGYGSGVVRVPKERIDAAAGDLPLGVGAWVKDVAQLIGETNLSLAREFRVNISTVQRDFAVAHSYEYIGTGGTYVYPPLPKSV